MRRLAIVNRGEAAMRALAAVAELNRAGTAARITTIAVHTDADAGAWFVREADEAVSLGPATYVDPTDGHRTSAYLDEERVVELLRAARADAVWVGWGFVAESASFAQRCEDAGMVYVGPDAKTIHLLGDKVAAKRIAEQAEVPVLPWSGGPVDSAEEAAAAAQRIGGFPVLLKAAAGGGGRGIRIVRSPDELDPALASARSEAQLAFGDPSVFLEGFVPRARHVEVQIIADGYGTTWAVGVRDCSIQRRNQKVIEESASTLFDTAAEHWVKDAAVRLAQAVGYRNAGTVEFLVDVDGRVMFMEVNTRLQGEHPVTEATTGLDLVKLQLHVAGGGRLEGRTPRALGHAVEVRLNAEDPEQGFAPAPGRIVLWRPPAGPGIRVDSGVTEGDVIAPEFDSMIAKIIAWGRDREEALARLRRALTQCAVVVEGGTTNRSFLLSLLNRPEVQEGRFDNRWLDRLTADGEHLPEPDSVAVLAAAVEGYDSDQSAAQAAFHAVAERGRPEAPEQVGHVIQLRYRGAAYRLSVFLTGPGSYRIDTGSGLVDVGVERLGDYERKLSVQGRSYRITAVTEGPTFLIDVDGTTHRVARDDGGVVRAMAPAFVSSVLVAPGDQVAAGDPLVVAESMKMETTITAPFAGTVASVLIAANTQVEAGAPLLRIREATETAALSDAAASLPVDFSALAAAPDDSNRSLFASLRSYLLGYDLDPETARRLVARQRAVAQTAAGDDEVLLGAEAALLDLFADVAGLYRPQPDEEEQDQLTARSTQEYLLSYLQWLDADRAGLPISFRLRLERALLRYDVPSLERTPALEAAVVWMFRSFSRVRELVPVVTSVLERWLRGAEIASALNGPEGRALLERLAAGAEKRHQVVADLARDVRFRYFDEPLLERVVAEVYAEMETHLDELAADPSRPDRAELVSRLVWCPQPLRGVMLHRWHVSDAEVRRTLLEVHAGRFYRIRELRNLRCDEHDGLQLGSADYEHEGVPVHLVVVYAPLAELARVARAVAAHLETVDPTREVVLDWTAWRSGPRLDDDAMAAELRDRLSTAAFGRRLHRLDVTLTSEGAAAEHERTQHFTFRQPLTGPTAPEGGAAPSMPPFVEELLYRNLHPMLAKRLDLWRLSNFALERLPSAEDIYLFRAVAHDNPKDVRLFALAEVRDLTPVPDPDGGPPALPRLERQGLLALSAMRHALAQVSPQERPQMNRIIIYIRPPWDVPRERWRDLGHSYAGLAAGVGLEKLVLRVQIPEGDRVRDAVLHVEGVGHRAVTVRERPPGNEPIRSLTEYGQKALGAFRLGTPYPYETIKMLTPPAGIPSDFPPGHFVEYDLDSAGEFVPVGRPYGLNTANLVVGVNTNLTPKVPEGLSRVAIFGDPTRSLGSLAEAECRRIMAALDLAERMRVPFDWFALSSGARIAMDSGTENMDWIGAVLRRIIEFTQRGGEVNVVVVGINVGAQPYWNAEATMLMHTRGILVMTPDSAMVLTGKQALDFSGGVSAEDNFGIGGYERVMGPNGQGQFWAPTLHAACALLLRHHDHTYVVPGERYPRRARTSDPIDRDVRTAPHAAIDGSDFAVVGDVFSEQCNPERKKPFDVRSVMRAVTDTDSEPLERWSRWRHAEIAVVWDAHIGGIPVALLGLESRTLTRRGFVPADGPPAWTSGTLFPQSSRKMARAINAASGNRPLVVLANLSGFDGSPESMGRWQLEYGAEIGRGITNFRGPIVFVVISRYHGGAFVVFSKRLNDRMTIAAVEGSYASVIGGAPAAAVVFTRDVTARTERDPRVVELRQTLAAARDGGGEGLHSRLHETLAAVRAEKLGEVAAEFDRIHSIQRALAVGSVDRIIPARDLRPFIIEALERGMADAPGEERAPAG